jgi:alpha-L-fucosidase
MKPCSRACLLTAIFILLTLPVSHAFGAPAPASLDPHANETKAQKDTRMAWWRAAKFGMFIHWGLYAHYAGSFDGVPTNGAGEWIMHDEKAPVAEYAAGASQFDPEKFNADTWVAIAKAAGMKYIVMTAKHHEGFAMFHTKVDSYNIYDATPFKRDPIAEMSAACKKAGIKFGVYYSQNLDWHHPGGGTAGPSWDALQQGDFDNYIKTISAPQVTELIENIHPAVLWFDIGSALTPDEVHALTESFKDDPGLIYNNRMGGGIPGDTETPEQHIPATGFKSRDWETCMTINNTWGYKAQDTDFKSTATLLHNLVDIASKGGNYLLNVGPDSTGVIPQPEVDRIEQIGGWLKQNGASIYGTSSSSLARLPANERMTVKGNTLYLHVFAWDGNASLPGLLTDVSSATTLIGKQSLAVSKDSDGITNIAPPANPDPIDTVVVLKLAGPLKVDDSPARIQPATDGSFTTTPENAILSGSLQVEGDTPNSDIGYWTDSSDTVKWNLSVPAGGGDYTAKITYSVENGTAGSIANLTASATSTLSVTTVTTGTWADYREFSVPGTLHLDGGPHTISFSAAQKPGFAVMNFRKLVLTPVAKQ